jgi:hypothetical protein
MPQEAAHPPPPRREDPQLAAIRRAVGRAEARMRLARILEALPTSLLLALAASGVAIACRKAFPDHVPERWAWVVLIGASLSVVMTIVLAAARRLPPHAGALVLDEHYRLAGRLTNALEFGAIDEARRTPMMGLAIEDACRSAKDLSARRAVRIPLPPELLVSAAVAAAVMGLGFLEVHRLIPPEKVTPPPALDALEITNDDVDLFKDALDELDRKDQDPEVQAAIERFNQLLEDIAEKRLNRTDAFKRMQEIENDLLKGAEADKKELEEELKNTAAELDKSDLTKPAAQALQKKDYKQTRDELKKLADQLRDKKKPVDKKALEKLRQALERAAKQKQQALDQINERRSELKEELLQDKKKVEEAKTKEEKEHEEELMRKKERELDRLDREAERKEKAQKRLSKLDRDLAKAAADLMRDLGASADEIDQAAEDINRMEEEELTDKQKEELRQRLEELRELIRQQGQGGEQMRKRLQRFLKKARGGKGGKGGQGGKGQKGQKGDQGEGDEGDQGEDGEGQDGEGQGQDGQGQDGEGEGDGEGQGKGQGKGLGLGQGQGGGKKIELEMEGGSGEGDGEEPGGKGSGTGGKQWGEGSGGNPKGDATDLDADTMDVRADAVDTHEGPTNAEVILSAAERGFTGKPYKKVYREYRTYAEDQIDKEQIPDGMRSYVRRYLELIRPRD